MIVYNINVKESKSGRIVMSVTRNGRNDNVNVAIPRIQEILSKYDFNTQNTSCSNELKLLVNETSQTPSKDVMKFVVSDRANGTEITETT